jgi:hypothetical protein
LDAYYRLLFKNARGCHVKGNQRDSNDDDERENGTSATSWQISEGTMVTYRHVTGSRAARLLVGIDGIAKPKAGIGLPSSGNGAHVRAVQFVRLEKTSGDSPLRSSGRFSCFGCTKTERHHQCNKSEPRQARLWGFAHFQGCGWLGAARWNRLGVTKDENRVLVGQRPFWIAVVVVGVAI